MRENLWSVIRVNIRTKFLLCTSLELYSALLLNYVINVWSVIRVNIRTQFLLCTSLELYSAVLLNYVITLKILFSIFENFVLLSRRIMFYLLSSCFLFSHDLLEFLLKYVLFAAELCFDIWHHVFHFSIMLSILGVFGCFAKLCSAGGLLHCWKDLLEMAARVHVNLLTDKC